MVNVNEVMTDNVVENIAQMNLEQRNLFVNTFVKKWPDLARSLTNMITLEQMARDMQIEMLNYNKEKK